MQAEFFHQYLLAIFREFRPYFHVQSQIYIGATSSREACDFLVWEPG